ncbi:TPA: DUF3631 domain-containing protein [Pseudomonas putida]|uniref:DUF3631 domain-containing protein n=1 Tax=Pseudomonas putida TaxID=303 RepID=A0A7Y7ZFC1_PSEPU|nr:DUF3631 domain-containing protein [Pseudomonas putida]NWC82694.1 DUF3631 domain-containing protein [Pseudomonas putida]HEK1691995.1 DUF3631 domain-containing protein [Pseudomonas putida]
MSDGKVITLMSKSPVQEAIKRLGSDAGALYEPIILMELKRVRAKEPATWARIRQQVKDTKVLSMVDFDRLTAQDDEGKASAGGGIFPEVEPWPSPVAGAELLDDIAGAIGRYVIADAATVQAAALWATFTWLIDSVQVAPIANITAPEKRCGKSIMLTALGNLVNRKLQVSNIAPAALFRSIELWSPTLLIDEVDAFLRDNEEARGILNAGFTRDSAVVIRCVGDDHMPTPFRVWGAKALCGIGKIADTLADRSIPLRLRRKLPGESTEVLRHSDPGLWTNLRSRMMRFAQDHAEQIGKARPATINGLNDRANDCWEPLLAIAEAAGGEWPAIARQAARSLHEIEDDSPSVGVELLNDIKTILDTKQANKMFSATLLEHLMADDEAPWPTWNRGKPMTARQLSTKLGEFGIKSKDIRIGTINKKGYDRADFSEAFTRYLSAETPAASATARQPTSHAASSDFSTATVLPRVADEKTLQATDYAGCRVVADETPLPLGVEDAAGPEEEEV